MPKIDVTALPFVARGGYVGPQREARNGLSAIADGNGPLDGGYLLLSCDEKDVLVAGNHESSRYLRRFLGSQEIINGTERWCLWIEDDQVVDAMKIPSIAKRVDEVRTFRKEAGTRAATAVNRPHKFAWINQAKAQQIAIPKVFSERRRYITAVFLNSEPDLKRVE